ncbi:MAG: hypothetical protein AAGJ84_09670 [Pseudomonadota bacterium]
MHILIALFGLLTALAVWYWRLKMIGDVARGSVEAAKTVANLPRRLAFKRKSGKKGLQIVDDPREAATILMLQVAQTDGVLSEKQKASIQNEIVDNFKFTETEADELIEHALWISADAGKPHATVSRMTDFVQHAPGLGPKEIVDLDSMLVSVSEAEGSPDSAQLDLLALFRRKAGLRV